MKPRKQREFPNQPTPPHSSAAVNIIGAGLAGLSAAMTLAEQGIPCRLVAPMPSERAQSVMAEGGINAALDTMGEQDDPMEHFHDTMKGGAFLADPHAVEGLCRHAPLIVQKLCSLGAALQMKDGQPVLRYFGGQKKRRTAYAQSSTGKILMTALIDAVRKYEASGLVRRYSHHRLYDLLVNGQQCDGVQVADSYTGMVWFLPGAVILASGGMNSLFPGQTTGSVVNTGDVTAQAFVDGAALANPEFIQFHPTTFAIPGKRCLVSEAARGEGGRLFTLRDGQKWYFMEEKYPELGNLMPRDVVSREIEMIRQSGSGQVWLDMTALERTVWAAKLADLRQECLDYLGKDPAEEPIEVSPGIHYYMGGLWVDEYHRTNIRGLYAAGECACQYHGANRLGGNSMLGAIYGGQVAAQTAAEESSQCPPKEEHMVEGLTAERMIPTAVSQQAAKIFTRALGIFRSGEILSQAVTGVEELIDHETDRLQRNRLLLGKAMLLSALHRQESRGAHTRTDYPAADDRYRKTTLVHFDGHEMTVTLQDIPERRGEDR